MADKQDDLKLNPRDHNGDPFRHEEERHQLAQEIDGIMRGQHEGFGTDAVTQARLDRMQRAYLDIVSGAKTCLDQFEMMDYVVEYLTAAEDQYPSLMEYASDHTVGNNVIGTAAAQVVALMNIALDPVLSRGNPMELSIGQAAQLCEKAYASYINLNGRERLRVNGRLPK